MNYGLVHLKGQDLSINYSIQKKLTSSNIYELFIYRL